MNHGHIILCKCSVLIVDSSRSCEDFRAMVADTIKAEGPCCRKCGGPLCAGPIQEDFCDGDMRGIVGLTIDCETQERTREEPVSMSTREEPEPAPMTIGDFLRWLDL